MPSTDVGNRFLNCFACPPLPRKSSPPNPSNLTDEPLITRGPGPSHGDTRPSYRETWTRRSDHGFVGTWPPTCLGVTSSCGTPNVRHTSAAIMGSPHDGSPVVKIRSWFDIPAADASARTRRESFPPVRPKFILVVRLSSPVACMFFTKVFVTASQSSELRFSSVAVRSGSGQIVFENCFLAKDLVPVVPQRIRLARLCLRLGMPFPGRRHFRSQLAKP